MRLENCESMERYVSEIMSAAHQLTVIGFEINEEWLGTVLLAGLPKMYQPMIMALESMAGMAITGDSVKIKLLQELNCFDKSKSTTANDDAAYHVKRQTKSVRPKPRSKELKCWICGKQGHVAKQCGDKRKNDKDNKDKKRSDSDKKKSDTDTKVAFLADNSLRVNDIGWIRDSAASYTCCRIKTHSVV